MSENSKSWFRLRWRTMFLLVIVGPVVWSAYAYWSEYSEQAARKAREMMAPTAGSLCTVLYRKEELGISTNVQGKFVKLNDDWIVLKEESGGQIWFPREHVLLIRIKP
ncbi:MAG: hypothetical protein GXP24_07255 [Planctomycetes bacterium]|nr:hypothetical protein [Planctomycetota bacterium]